MRVLQKQASMYTLYFYQARMNRTEAHRLHTDFKRLNHDSFEYDASVYKQAGKQQVFRCPLSFKIDYNPESKEWTKHIEKHVQCPDWLVPAWFIAQIDGNEEYTATFDDLANILGTHEVSEVTGQPYGTVSVDDHSPYTLDEFIRIYQRLCNTEIHYGLGAYYNLYLLIPALNTFRNEYIQQSEVEDALEWLSEHGRLSDNARMYLNRQIRSLINTKAPHAGTMLKYIRNDNTEYYTSTVEPILERVKRMNG
jgi:hypothetical protein